MGSNEAENEMEDLSPCPVGGCPTCTDDGPLYPDGSDADGFPGGDQRMGGDRRVAQVGGAHYQAEYQHWHWVEDIGMGYLECVATKYLVRWQRKDGLQDLKKARSYVQQLMVEEKGGRSNRSNTRLYDNFYQYCVENEVAGPERDATFLLYTWRVASDLELVVQIINTIIVKNFPQEFESKVGGDPSWSAA